MIFKVSTKPLCDSLNLGIINANVSKFYRRSCVARLSATKDELVVNLEASKIVSEIRVKGCGDAESCNPIFVDCLLLKQLVNTFDSKVTEIEFTENAVILHAGKSKFTLARENADIDASEIEFRCPKVPTAEFTSIDLNKSAWKYVKDHQMYALGMSFQEPIYTRVWVGSDGNVLVGDMDNGIFTDTKKSNLPSTCLLTDTIINLFNSLPEDSKIFIHDGEYIVDVKNDSYAYRAQFEPEYEGDEFGSYNSDIILGLLTAPESGYVRISTEQLSKFLGQAELLARSVDDRITLTVANNEFLLQDNNVHCSIEIKSIFDHISEYEIPFKISTLKQVLNSYDSETVNIGPNYTDDEISGIVVWDDNLITVLAGVED